MTTARKIDFPAFICKTNRISTEIDFIPNFVVNLRYLLLPLFFISLEDILFDR